MNNLTVEQLLTKEIELNFQLLSKTKSKHMLAKTERIKKMVLWVVNDLRMRNYILNFKARDGSPQYAQTDKSRMWHLRQFVEANERGLFTTDFEWDIKLKYYFKRISRVLGYTTKGSDVINSNTKFSYGMDDWDFVANIVHEMCHVFLMVHTFKKNKHQWPDTAPYAIGNYAAYLCENFYIAEANGNVVNVPVVPEVIPEKKIIRPSWWGRVKLFFKKWF